MKTYKQLIYELRCQISALKKTGLSQNKIARQLKVNQSTISRELFRSTVRRGYRIKQAQSFIDNRRLLSRKAIKMTSKLVALMTQRFG